jgi:hypothetical protein
LASLGANAQFSVLANLHVPRPLSGSQAKQSLQHGLNIQQLLGRKRSKSPLDLRVVHAGTAQPVHDGFLPQPVETETGSWFWQVRRAPSLSRSQPYRSGPPSPKSPPLPRPPLRPARTQTRSAECGALHTLTPALSHPMGEGESFAAALKYPRLDLPDAHSQSPRPPAAVPSPGGEGQDEGERLSIRSQAEAMAHGGFDFVQRCSGNLPGAGAAGNREGSSERSWKQRKTVSMGRPLSPDEMRTLVG